MGCLEASKWPNNYNLAHTEAHLCGPSSTNHPVYHKSMRLGDSHLHIIMMVYHTFWWIITLERHGKGQHDNAKLTCKLFMP